MIAVHLEQHPGRIEDGFSSVLAHHCGREGECAHLEDIGVAEHFVECPCVGRNDLIAIAIAAEVCPLVDGDGNGLRAKSGNALEVFLVVLIFRADLDGRRAFPFKQRQRRFDGYLLLQLHVGMLRAGCVIVLADHVDVVEAIEEHLAGPICWGKIIRNILTVDAPGLVCPFHHVGHGAASDELDGWIDLAHLLGEEVVLQLELRKRHGSHLVVAPGLVADAPELHVIRRGVAVCGAPFAHGRRSGAVGVFDKLTRRPCVAEASVDGDVGIDAEQAT